MHITARLNDRVYRTDALGDALKWAQNHSSNSAHWLISCGALVITSFSDGVLRTLQKDMTWDPPIPSTDVPDECKPAPPQAFSRTFPDGRKVTIAHFKRFVERNRGSLMIKVLSSFDGIIDGGRFYDKPAWEMAQDTGGALKANTLGVAGVWLVGGGRDFAYFYDDGHIEMYKVVNSCGSFILGVQKQAH